MLFTLELHPVCGAKCFMTPAIHVWCKKFARGRENVDEEHPGHAASNQQPTSFFSSGIHKFVERWGNA